MKPRRSSYLFLLSTVLIVACGLAQASQNSTPPTVTHYAQPVGVMCTAPVCEVGNLVCGESAGCPGGCGTICQPFTPTPAGSVVFDFAAQLCHAKWTNGGQNLTACPAQDADHSGGFAELVDPVSVGYPFNLQVLRMIPSWNGYSSLFLRYPSLTIDAADHFQALLSCDYELIPCDVQFALEYYDARGKYHSPYLQWNLTQSDPALNVDAPLRELAGQKVELVLALRLFHSLNTPQQDNGLWVSPRIYRLLQ